MDLDGSHRRAHLGGHLPIGHSAIDHEPQQLPLSTGELLEAAVDDHALSVRAPALTARGERAPDAREQELMVERFLENVEGPRLHGEDARPDVTWSRDEDDGDRRLAVSQLGLKIETTSPLSEKDIENETRGLARVRMPEKGLGGGKGQGAKVHRAEQATERMAHLRVVVYDVHQACRGPPAEHAYLRC